MNTAQEIIDAAFHGLRTERSPEYIAGALAFVKFRLGEIDAIYTPYRVGTAQADAFFAGIDEGRRLVQPWKTS